jgi:hypothetical protein
MERAESPLRVLRDYAFDRVGDDIAGEELPAIVTGIARWTSQVEPSL